MRLLLILEPLIFALMLLFIITQVLIPITLGKTTFPIFRFRKEQKRLEELQKLSEKADLHNEFVKKAEAVNSKLPKQAEGEEHAS